MTRVVMWANRWRTATHQRTRQSTRQSLVTLEVIAYRYSSSNAGRKMPTGVTVADGWKSWSQACVGTRLLPPRANGPTLTVALASIERRNTVSAASAARLTAATWAKMASVAGSFFAADSSRLSAGSSPAHSAWCRWFPPSGVSLPGSLFGRSTGGAPRPLSGGYRDAGSGTVGRLGSGCRRWRVYPSGDGEDALPHACAHAG